MAISGRGCLKIGCFGCLGCAGLLLGLFGLLALGVALDSGTSSEQIRESFDHRPTSGAVSAEEWLSGEFEGSHRPKPKGAGVVHLELDVGQFHILPAAAGTPLRVEADYDLQRFRLTESFQESTDGSWEYRVRFKKKGFLFQFQDGDADLTIYLPEDLVFELTGDLGIGDFDVELGGLALTSVDIEASIGDFDVKFSRPTAAPIDSFIWDGSIGEHTISRLGNASPKYTRIGSSIGELSVDLHGAWRADGTVHVNHSIGEARVSLPKEGVKFVSKGVGITLGERSVRIPKVTEEGVPVVELSVHGSIGETRVR